MTDVFHLGTCVPDVHQHPDHTASERQAVRYTGKGELRGDEAARTAAWLRDQHLAHSAAKWSNSKSDMCSWLQAVICLSIVQHLAPTERAAGAAHIGS